MTQKYEVMTCVDWYSYTCKDPVYHEKMALAWLDGKGMLGYTTSRTFLCGAKELVCPERPEMGTHVIYDGDAMRNMEKIGVGNIDVLRLGENGRCARIDVAIDVRGDCPFTVADVEKATKNMITTARKSSSVRSLGEAGHTVYVGAPQSEARLRVYDKAAETGNMEEEWIRIELQLRGSKAVQAHRRVIDHGAGIIGAIIKGFVDFPDIEWESVTSAAGLIMRTQQKTNTGTVEWLMNQCAPVLGKILAITNDSEIWKRFILAVTEAEDDWRGRVQVPRFDKGKK